MHIHEQGGERLALLVERAIFHPRTRTLFIADPHFGKSATFRSFGIPIPAGGTDADLTRLTRALKKTGATRLTILGDFLHAARGRCEELFARLNAWRAEHAELEIVLIRGNHDRSAGDPPDELRIDCRDEGEPHGAFVLRHEPGRDERGYVLAGHIHPALGLNDGSGTRVRAACFWFGATCGVLPAFGGFTGGAGIAPVFGDAIYLIGPDAVLPVKTEEFRPSKTRTRAR